MITVTPFVGLHLAFFGVERDKYRTTDDATITQPALDERMKLEPIELERVDLPPDPAAPSLSTCAIRREANEKMRIFRSLSLMSGAGGIDIGLANTDNSGYFRTEWAIERSKSSLKTFAAHHPHTSIIEMDVGEALMRRPTLSSMPIPGEVDTIIMGPPCQSFSSLNRVQTKTRVFDERSLLVATGLSYVDVYRPVYGVIENVCGMLKRGDLGEVERDGVVKFIRACLHSMGYRSRFCPIQCGHFGVPQKRSRIKILFSKFDVRLPLAPIPTTKLAGEAEDRGGAGAAITIDDATSDLPRFDFWNPHEYYDKSSTLQDARPSNQRPLRFKRSKRGTFGSSSCEYASPPQNDFQQRMRPHHLSDGCNTVSEHYTLPVGDKHVERIHNIPFSPGSNASDLWRGFSRIALHPSVERADLAANEHAYRRLEKDGAFQIVTTMIYLGGKHGRLLLPDQQRIPTLRELARAQGFPDRVRFFGSPSEILRQIGNAVPIPLASAIGLTIREAAVDDYLDGDRRFAREDRS